MQHHPQQHMTPQGQHPEIPQQQQQGQRVQPGPVHLQPQAQQLQHQHQQHQQQPQAQPPQAQAQPQSQSQAQQQQQQQFQQQQQQRARIALIKPDVIEKLPWLPEGQRNAHVNACRNLWQIINTSPSGSAEFVAAQSKLYHLSSNLIVLRNRFNYSQQQQQQHQQQQQPTPQTQPQPQPQSHLPDQQMQFQQTHLPQAPQQPGMQQTPATSSSIMNPGIINRPPVAQTPVMQQQQPQPPQSQHPQSQPQRPMAPQFTQTTTPGTMGTPTRPPMTTAPTPAPRPPMPSVVQPLQTSAPPASSISGPPSGAPNLNFSVSSMSKPPTTAAGALNMTSPAAHATSFNQNPPMPSATPSMGVPPHHPPAQPQQQAHQVQAQAPHQVQQQPSAADRTMPIPKTLDVKPLTPVPTAGAAGARPTLTGGQASSSLGVMNRPALEKYPGYVIEGEGQRVMSKKMLDTLVMQVTGGGGGGGGGGATGAAGSAQGGAAGAAANGLTPDAEEFILQMTDDFVDDVVSSACRLAKMRDSTTLDVRDLQLVLERNYNMRISGFSTDDLRTVRKPHPTQGWFAKMSAVQAAKVTHGKME